MKVLITCRQMQNCFEEFRERFESEGLEVIQPEVVQQPGEQELADLVRGVDGMIAGDDPITATVLEHADRLRVISKWGVGVDGIDVETARARGIAVTRTPDVFGEEVADVAIGYMVMLARQLHRMHASVLENGWLKYEGSSLNGKTLGIVGLGDIGRAVARRGAGFGMTLLGSDIVEPDAATLALGLRHVALEELLAGADVVVLCCPLTPETHHLIDAERLGGARRGLLLINVARGPLVDEEALVAALESGQVAAAALDVFEREPLPPASALRRFHNCVFGTHNGSNTREAVLRASERAFENLLQGLRG
jgi:phosphoglycerate dehydrogenase-like enzyme